MVQDHRGTAGVVSRQYLLERQGARETAMSTDEFSPQEIEEWDLDTARIDGSDNPDTYTTEPYGERQESVDYREVDPRF